jgi:hypothetical protein
VAEAAETAVHQKVDRAEVRSNPFPHLVIPDVLPEPYFEELASSIPPVEQFEPSTHGLKFDLPLGETNSYFAATPESFKTPGDSSATRSTARMSLRSSCRDSSSSSARNTPMSSAPSLPARSWPEVWCRRTAASWHVGRAANRITYQAHILPKHDVRRDAEDFADRLASPGARTRWQRYVEGRRARAAEKAQAAQK